MLPLLFLTSIVSTIPSYSDTVKNNPALNKHVYEIRNPKTDPKNFRNNLEKIGEYLALQVSEDLDTKE